MKPIKVIRKTTESQMSVTLDFSPIKPDYRKNIKTPLAFLNHMIEHIAWRAGFNIEIDCGLSDFALTHVICEDLGIAFGKACKEYIKQNDGAFGFGDAIGIIDEAKSECAISFESRAFIDFDLHNVDLPKTVEGMASEDLLAFLEGFVQGAMCTMQIDVLRGVNGHHICEAIFRSFGSALKNVFTIDESRKGMTSGVAGKIEWIIE